MKVKEIDRTANIAWSPAAQHPVYICAGTAAQQLDATFSTTAALEIYSLNLTEPGLDMNLKGSVVADYRFHKVAWGCHGMTNRDHLSGVVVGGADSGNLLVYDPVKILEGENALICQRDKHTSAVYSLDFNSFQPNLLASGSGDSEIFIWDLNNPNNPMTPGAKSQPAEEVTCVAWNKQVQHILASTFPARCVVWDLRKNEPIIKVSDTTSRIRCKMLAWNPEVATQLCLASEDDHCPVIQLWDLRFATSPLKTLEYHQRGVLSIAWCLQDPDLLLSCGKDSKILCWNPNSDMPGGEVVCEILTSNQWSFDVSWCARNPAIIACSSCDGHISVYSLMGGQQQVQPSSKIVEAFPGTDAFAQMPLQQASQRPVSMSLKKPPKWLRKPVGASFGFGGKLVSFGHQLTQQQLVYISQVVTDPAMTSRAATLETAISSGNLADFCRKKIADSGDQHHRIVWSFLQANFDPSPRANMLSLLGYDPQAIASQVSAVLSKTQKLTESKDVDGLDFSNRLNLTDTEGTDSVTLDGGIDAFEAIAAKEKETVTSPFAISTDDSSIEGLLTKALLTGNVESAVDLCISEGHWADALILSQAEGSALLEKTQRRYFRSMQSTSVKLVSAVVTADWRSIVQNCEIECWKEALAAILTYSKPEEFTLLCETLGGRLEMEKNESMVQNAILCYICAGNLERLAHCWMKAKNKVDSSALQEMVEQVVILRKAVQQMSGQAPPLQTGLLSTLLNKYAGLLASQGCLASAITYLIDATNEPTLALLRDRIYQALGMHSPHVPFSQVDVKAHPTTSYPQPQAYQQKSTQHPMQQMAPPQYSQPVHPNPSSSYSQPPQMGSQFRRASSSSQPPTPTSLTSPPSLPEQPQSAIQTKGHGLSHRYPSHLHDPSVYSEPSFYQQSAGFGAYSQPQPSFPQQPFSQPAAAPPFYSMEQNLSGPAPTYTVAQTNPPVYSTGVYSTAAPSLTAAPPIQPPVSGSQQWMQSYPGDPKCGWNDPPLLDPNKQTPGLQYESVNPMTAPVSGPAAGDQHPGEYYIPGPPSYLQPAPVPAPASQPPQAHIPEVPKEKGPVPPEHQILQDIFDDLRQQCQRVASNPQQRRKLDDVARKLEFLYDKLRDGELSPGAIMGMHKIVQAVQQGDYSGSLGIHSQLVSTTNFSETSSFLPGVKTLLQLAQTLGVYLQ